MKELKTLIFDIETSPNVGYFWRAGYKINISHDAIIEEKKIICIAYKWSGKGKAKFLQWDFVDGEGDDSSMLEEFSSIYNSADVVVAHFGDNFDIPWIKSRLMYHNLAPLAVVTSIDTKKEFSRNFNLNSNKLDYIAKYLGHEGKSKMDFSDWKDIMRGSRTKLAKMTDYCKRDVEELDQVYIKSRRYIPNSGLYQAFDREACPHGHLAEHQQARGIRVTKAGRYQRYQCQECGAWWSDRRMIKNVKRN